MAAGRLNTK